MSAITEAVGDIFAAPEGSILMHACNCQGSWGAGVAAAFKAKFPAAYKIYHEHCTVPGTLQSQKGLLGTTLLIPPQERDQGSRRYWIACLMTSLRYGRAKAKPNEILDATREALLDMDEQIQELVAKGEKLDHIWSVRLNSKLFNVPWSRTKGVLEQSKLKIHVVRPKGEDLAADVAERKARAEAKAATMEKATEESKTGETVKPTASRVESPPLEEANGDGIEPEEVKDSEKTENSSRKRTASDEEDIVRPDVDATVSKLNAKIENSPEKKQQKRPKI